MLILCMLLYDFSWIVHQKRNLIHSHFKRNKCKRFYFWSDNSHFLLQALEASLILTLLIIFYTI